MYSWVHTLWISRLCQTRGRERAADGQPDSTSRPVHVLDSGVCVTGRERAEEAVVSRSISEFPNEIHRR